MRLASLTLVICGLIAGCGVPVDQNAVQAPPKEAPPAAIEAAPLEMVAPASTLDICLRDAAETPATDACYEAEATSRQTELGRYVAAARERLADEPAALAAFNTGQQAWEAYRDAHCSGVLERWKDGTIRTMTTLGCRIDLMGQRTHQVWKDYLTFRDSTPPVLPEPMRE